VRHDESAQVNVITNEFQRPTSSLEFDPSQREENPLLMEYLMLHGNLSDEDARQEIAAFVADCYAKLREGETVTFEGIGTMSFNSFQEPEFVPDTSSDFNAESFGLEDLEAQPVFSTTTPDIRTPEPSAIETSMVDEYSSELVNEPEPVKVTSDPIDDAASSDDDPQHRRWWLWLLLLLLVAGGVVVWYFHFRQVEPAPPTPPAVVEIDTIVKKDSLDLPGLIENHDDTLVTTTDSSALQGVVETQEIVEEPVPPIEVVKPDPESKAFIVGGCFSVKENALNMAMEAYNLGCAGTFVMKRGEKFYVCYGQYRSNADAKAALPEILEKYNQKAWILIK